MVGILNTDLLLEKLKLRPELVAQFLFVDGPLDKVPLLLVSVPVVERCLHLLEPLLQQRIARYDFMHLSPLRRVLVSQ